MLQHDPQSSQSVPDAAHTRIKGDRLAMLPDDAPPTTQEIAQAIAALEARGACRANGATQAITVSEVIQHLGLDMTAEDVLAEIQAQRLRHTPMRPLSPAKRHGLALICAVGAFAFFGAVWVSSGPKRETEPAPPTPAFTQTAFLPAPTPLSITPNVLVQDTVGHATVLKTLAEIPDGHPVQCRLTPEGSAEGTSPFWTIVKHGGKVYLRGWTVPMSAQAMQQTSRSTGMMLFRGRGGWVGNLRATVPLTLALRGITLPEGVSSSGGDLVVARDVHLDSHAHERWQP